MAARFLRRLALLACALALTGTARAETHALIMTIGEYQNGVPPLRGVRHDAETGAAIARAMGVKDQNIVRLKDGELTLAGIRRAFDELARRLQPNDHAFIYYSGHGGRQHIPAENRCAESLISVDAQPFLDAEMQTRLQILSQKAEKLVVFFDACHSGGVATRALGSAKFAPKYFAKGGLDACQTPINKLTRSLAVAAKSAGSGAQNYVVIAAAQDNEVALDQPGKGGVASQAWLACLKGEARDLDGSGALSAEEVRQCAQQKIEHALKDVEGYKPHHISISGNANAVLGFAAASAPAGGAAFVSPQATLADIYHRRDDRRTITLRTTRDAFRINRDKVEFEITSSHAGHVYLLMAGSDGRTFDMLFPNKLDKSNEIEPGQTLRLPRTNWEIVAQGPAGRNHLLAIVSDSPRDFAQAGMTPAGPFSVVNANPMSAKDIVLVSGSSANAASNECAGEITKRALAVQRSCSNAYGAAVTTVVEVD